MKLYLLALALLVCALAAAPVAFHGNSLGNPKAPVTIEVFSDFQCPACKRFHDEELPLLVKEYVDTGKAYLVFRYFPLPQHTYGRKAAELVCACAQIGKYEPAADILFAKQAELVAERQAGRDARHRALARRDEKSDGAGEGPERAESYRSGFGQGTRASVGQHAHGSDHGQIQAI